ERFAANLQDARPTFFFAVPRIWTKLRLGVLSKMPAEKLDRLLKIPLVSTLIKRKIRSGLGLDKSRCNVTGAAPIPTETKAWFAKLGIPIAEAYGMTENGATSHMIRAEEHRPGSVGRPQAGTEHRIDPETQEVLTRSPYTMAGYYKSPKKTAETIDEDGWLHTGDQGRIDEDGYLYLTGRVKDTFKTAKAKFIVPTEIEDKFIGNDDIEQMCLLGLGMPQPIMLVALSEIGEGKPKEAVTEGLTKQLNSVNEKLASYKKVATILVVKEAFTVENNLMTPTLKVKRSQVHQQYVDRLLAWIESGQPVIWE
ncbi:MAG: AMP-binding protein, partial [Bacteroidota bacterium]